MKSFTLLAWCSLASSALAFQSAPTECTLDQVTYVTNAGVSYPIDPNAVFTIQHPGHFRARVAFVASQVDSQTNLFAQPNMVPLWGIRNGFNAVVGKKRWMGDDEQQQVMPILDFDPNTGAGHAQLDVPVAQFIGTDTYAALPKGAAKLGFVFGEQGVLDLDAAGNPVGHQWFARYMFATDYPDLYAAVEETYVGRNERVQLNVFMDDCTDVASTLFIEVIGAATFYFDGVPASSWTIPIPAHTELYMHDVIAATSGSYRFRATLNGALVAESQWCEVANHADDVIASISGLTGGDPGSVGTVNPTPINGRHCRPAACSASGGDKEMRCTRPFIELLEAPLNPDCPGPVVGVATEGGCVAGEEACVKTTADMSCPKYEYAGTVDRSCGSVMVGVEVGASGEVEFKLLGSGAKAGGHVDVTTQVESPITRRCCKYTPVEGESVTVSLRSCQ
ncbi:MAG: hypothetical protein IT454_03250 [Planctomycetes bacterium]|nr:hypothetical protein [Planctomycetota bacterium]